MTHRDQGQQDLKQMIAVNGGLNGEAVGDIAMSLRRIADCLSGRGAHQPAQVNGAANGAPNGESPYLDAQQAAAYLGITAKSLYGQVERRRIIPLRGPRRQYRFTTDMLDAYLRRNQDE